VGVAAWYLLKQRHYDIARRSIRLGLLIAIVASLGMFLTGDFSARQVANTQPVKFAAMQGVFDTQPGAPMIIFSLPPTQDGPANAPSIVITSMLSFMTHGDVNAVVVGLNDFSKSLWPPVTATFLAYHNMVVLGTLMLVAMALGVLMWLRRRIEISRTWLWIAVLATPLPLIATELGWATAEIGRQPWIVYGLMLTADGVSPLVSSFDVTVSLLGFGGMYVVLGVLWLFLLRRVLITGPLPAPTDSVLEEPPEPIGTVRPPRPVEVPS